MANLTYALEAYFITLAICGLFHVGLAANVVRHRMRSKISLGHGDDSVLHFAMRAFSNFTECMPITLFLIGANTMMGAHVDLIFIMCLVFLFARVLHAYSLLHFEQLPVPTLSYRKVAIALNFLVILFSGSLLLVEMLTNNFNPF